MDLNKMISSVSNNEQVKGLMSSLVSKSGGLQGLMGKLGSGGLQDQVRSWIGTGTNEQVSAQQVQEAVGSDNLAEAARQAGMSTDQAASQLAQAIPQLIDQATPEGSVPQQDTAVPGQAGGMQQDTAVPGQATGEQSTPSASR
jgi:uncharacterized protein YidB (DUF937 family)